MTARTAQFSRQLTASLAELCPFASPPRDQEADAARVRAGLAGPVRRNMGLDQAPVEDLPLFIAADEPRLL